MLLIQKGDKHLYYNKEKHAYTEWDDPNAYEQYMPVSLTPDQFLQPWTSLGVVATMTEHPVDAQFSYHGQPCGGNVEFDIPPVSFNGGQPFFGRSSLHAYLSRNNRYHMLAGEFRQWDVSGNHLVESEDVEYTYGQDIPETLFHPGPPKGAVRDDHMPSPKLARDFLPFHAMHYLGASRFPALPRVKPRMFQYWYRDPDRYRVDETGYSRIYQGNKLYVYYKGTGACKEETSQIPFRADELSVQSQLDELKGQGREVTTTTTPIELWRQAR